MRAIFSDGGKTAAAITKTSNWSYDDVNHGVAILWANKKNVWTRFYNRSYDDVMAPHPSSQVGGPAVIELIKDELNEDIYGAVMAMVEHLCTFESETLFRIALSQSREQVASIVATTGFWTGMHPADKDELCKRKNPMPPMPGVRWTFEHWKNVNVLEDAEYKLHVYLLVNFHSLGAARLANYENRVFLRCSEMDKVLTELEKLHPEDDDPDRDYDDDSEEDEEHAPDEAWEEFLNSRKLQLEQEEVDESVDPYDPLDDAFDAEDLFMQGAFGIPRDLRHYQIHPVTGSPYL